VSGANRVGNVVAELAGQADVVKGELERLLRGLDEVDDPLGDLLGGLAAVGQLVKLETQNS
jgi:ABC-type transporter Mla subunit MlaD